MDQELTREKQRTFCRSTEPGQFSENPVEIAQSGNLSSVVPEETLRKNETTAYSIKWLLMYYDRRIRKWRFPFFSANKGSRGVPEFRTSNIFFRDRDLLMSSIQYKPFPQTHWSLVQRAGMTDAAARSDALSTLLERYRPALYSYLQLRHVERDARDELLQGFIAEKLLDPEFLQRADPRRGRFRNFLLRSLDNYATDVQRKLKVRRTAVLQDEILTLNDSRPEDAVDLAWARELIRSVLLEMRQYCHENGRLDLWKIFDGRVLRQAFGTSERASYASLVDEVGVESPTKAANLLVSAKRLYERLLRRAIGEYEMDEEAIDAEIADLLRILARAASNEADYGI